MKDLVKENFFTVESREDNRYSQWKKKYKFFTKDRVFLPSAEYIYNRHTSTPIEDPLKKLHGLSFSLDYL